MATTRGAKRRTPDDPDELPDKDGSPSGRKKPRIAGGAPQTPGAQNMSVNGTPAAASSSMLPPPIPPQQGQQGPPGGGQQQQQPGQPQQAQTPQGQPSTPQVNRLMGMGMGGGVGLGQQRSGTGGPLGTMPSLPYTNSGVMNGARVSMSGAAGVPGTPGAVANVGGPGGMPIIPNTGQMGNQVGHGL